MPVSLVRKSISVDVHDADAVRAWLKERVALEVKVKGQPITKLMFLADGNEEVQDLTSTISDDTDAHMGATFQLLRRRPTVERAFLILRMQATDAEGQGHSYAVVFEEITQPDEPRRWWMSMQEFRTDANTEIGHLIGDWQDSPFETPNIDHLMPFLREFAAPPPGSRPARVLPPRATQPDIRVATGKLPPTAPTPTTAKMMTELATSTLSSNEFERTRHSARKNPVGERHVRRDRSRGPTSINPLMRHREDSQVGREYSKIPPSQLTAQRRECRRREGPARRDRRQGTAVRPTPRRMHFQGAPCRDLRPETEAK